jgi:uncharacterized protein (DUF1501 family)
MNNRREFLRTAAGASIVSFSAATPGFLASAALGQDTKVQPERILVVIQFSGGNDGLNTVIPYKNAKYHSARPNLGFDKDDVRKINDDLGFHPSLSGVSDLLEAGQLSVIQNVGYPNPNRSHFESMDIWHSCHRKDQLRSTGWLGRLLDGRNASGKQGGGVHIGQEVKPLALAADHVPVTSIASIERFQLQLTGRGTVEAEQLDKLLNSERNDRSNLLDFVQSNSRAAVATSTRIEKALQAKSSDVTYPDSGLGKKLELVSKMIRSNFPASVYYVTLDGFDTHAQQADAHSGLLREWSGALSSFVEELQTSDCAERVLTMTFSEFGRRVQENASEGTDHGAAAPMFLAGPVKAGPFGDLPNLDDLNDGDIKFKIDFRQVYATVLDQWLGWDSQAVIGKAFESLPVLNAVKA